MISKEITICGKQAKVAYCYATELAYKRNSKQEISTYFDEARNQFAANELPDTEKTICLIHAAMSAFYGNDVPMSVKDIENEARPMELAKALGTIISLRSEFYTIPDELNADKEDEGTKNV